MSAELNKTIVISYDEVTRMREFCLENNAVTREFYDWYLNEDAFFTRTGMLIIENAFENEKVKFCMSFDFTNANIVLFNIYDYATQSCVASYRFLREENMKMEKVNLLLKYYDKKYFKDNKLTFFETKDGVSKNNMRESVKKLEKNNNYNFDKNASKGQLINERNKMIKDAQVLDKKLEQIRRDIAYEVCRQGVYYCYATMYYFAKNKPKEIIGKRRDSIINDGLGKQIKVAYKYTGYININEHKIYKSTVQRPEGEEARKYGRHVEKWSVRGHYRRVNGKSIWIESHERGEGELEKRIYGTENESDVNVIPKVFEVERNVSDKDAVKPEQTFKEKVSEHFNAPFEEVIKSTKEVHKKIIKGENKKQNLITRIKNILKKLITWKI